MTKKGGARQDVQAWPTKCPVTAKQYYNENSCDLNLKYSNCTKQGKLLYISTMRVRHRVKFPWSYLEITHFFC